MKIIFFVFSLFVQLFSRKFRFLSNPRPIIGIISEPSFSSYYPRSEYSFIASSYVKFLESSGARVVPIHYDSSEEELKMMLDKVNGLLIPGGGGIDILARAGQFLLNLAIEKNINGVYFPIWGTCLGHEIIINGLTNETNLLSFYNSINVRLKLRLTNVEKSKVYNSIDKDLLEYIENEEVLFFSHNYALDIERFYENKILRDFFFITSTVQNHEGKKYISSIEGKNFPIYGIQYHPEKSPFEWNESLNISRDPKAIRLSQNYGNFIVNEAKKNDQHFFDKEEEDLYSIHQFSSIFLDGGYTECYFFKNKKSNE